jgi:hypothetical protein
MSRMLIILFFSSLAFAQADKSATDGAKTWRGVFVFGADFGGDSLVNVTYANGARASVEAGRGIILGGGAVWTMMPGLELQTTLSYKFTTIPQATNGDVTWTRIPLEIAVFQRLEKWRYGGGITFQSGASLEGSGLAAPATSSFATATGLILEGDWQPNDKYSLGLKYTSISYKSTTFNSTANGSSTGLTMNMFF